MVKLSVREAAKRFNVSRPTLVKRLKSGQLSGEPVTGGGWLIDPAELIRSGYVARPEGGQVSGGIKIDLSGLAGPLPGAAGSDEVAALKAALEAERIRREAAEALAAERCSTSMTCAGCCPAGGQAAPLVEVLIRGSLAGRAQGRRLLSDCAWDTTLRAQRT